MPPGMDGPPHDAPEASGLACFVQALSGEGRAVVAVGAPPADDAPGRAALEELDARARAELGLEAPPLCPDSAAWAARLLYQLCQFTVFRDIDEATIRQACRMPCPGARGPSTDWSADLTLRHLGKIFDLARHLSQADPLLAELRRLAAAWPLSSVGVPGLEPGLRLDSFLGHPALHRIYADRILARGDHSRLGNAIVDDGLRVDLGAHPDLAPALASRLFPQSHESH